MDYTSPVSPEQEALLEALDCPQLDMVCSREEEEMIIRESREENRQLLAEFVVRVQAEALEGAAKEVFQYGEESDNPSIAYLHGFRDAESTIRSRAAQLREQA